MWYPSLDPIKVVKCRECGVDVNINANYPVEAVDCRPWYCPNKKKHASKPQIDGNSSKTE